MPPYANYKILINCSELRSLNANHWRTTADTKEVGQSGDACIMLGAGT